MLYFKYLLLKIFTVHKTTNIVILFFGFNCQNIGSRVLRISQICFPRQGLSNGYSMSFVLQFWIFDLNIEVTDILGARGPKLKGEPPSSVNAFLAWQATLYLLARLHGQKSLSDTRVWTGLLAELSTYVVLAAAYGKMTVVQRCARRFHKNCLRFHLSSIANRFYGWKANTNIVPWK